MGRKKKYFTQKEKNEAQRKWSMEYYWSRFEEIRKKNLKLYHEKNKN